MTHITRRELLQFGSGALAATALAATWPGMAPRAAAASRPILLAPSLGADFFTIGADGSGLSRAGRGVEPAWAGGDAIVYAVWDREPVGIYLAARDGSAPVLLQPGKEYLQPTVAPSGRELAYLNRFVDLVGLGPVKREDPITGINFIGIRGGQPAAPPVGTQDNFGIGWSPDGETFLWQAEGGIYRSPVPRQPQGDGPQPQRLRLGKTDSRYAMPRWSPVSQTIVLQYKQHDHWEIGLMNAEGGEFRLITGSAPFDPVYSRISPAWSPDGSQIAFMSNEPNGGETFTLWVMGADGSGRRQISDVPARPDYIFQRLVAWA